MSQTHSILDGKVSLYHAKNTANWQCSFRIEGQLIRQTTKQDDLDKAKVIAEDLYITARVKQKEGIAFITRTFRSIAEATLTKLNTDKKKNRNYIDAINNYLIPHFGSKSITTIDGDALTEFAVWRKNKMGKEPSKVTVDHHNVAINAVFATAVEKKIMSRFEAPETKKGGAKQQRRPDFTNEEYVKLHRYMYRKWITERPQGNSVMDRRHVLREYVLFIVNTGCRPGTETDGLKFKHIRTYIQKGIEYVAVSVDGKRGRRELVARHGVVRPLERIVEKRIAFKGMTLRQVLDSKSDEFVFATPDGVEADNLGQLFTNLLIDCGLHIDPRTDQPRVLYSLRHTAITMAIMNGIDVYDIAKNCGTSVAMIAKNYDHALNLAKSATLAGPKR